MNETAPASALLRQVIEVHGACADRLDALLADGRDAHANWKPAADAWSIAECIEHLNRTLEPYLAKAEDALAKAKATGRTGEPPYGRGTLFGRFLVGFLAKGPSKKVGSPKTFRPASSGLEIPAVRDAFHANVERLSQLARDADGLALGKIRFGTPVSSLLRVSLAQMFEVHVLHTPRHMGQAERVTRADGFPGQPLAT